MTRRLLIPVLAAAALALAGCGGGDGGGDGNGGTPGPGGIDTTDTLYQAGFSVCASASPAELKNEYITETTDPEEIGERVGISLVADPAEAEKAKQGCIAGMKSRAGD
jgi:hypothetical protein